MSKSSLAFSQFNVKERSKIGLAHFEGPKDFGFCRFVLQSADSSFQSSVSKTDVVLMSIQSSKAQNRTHSSKQADFQTVWPLYIISSS